MSSRDLAIALCRVSSLEQLESNSLSHQRDNVLRAADELGVTIPGDGIWSGHVSSKKGVNYDRKDLKEMLEYCKNHSNVRYLIVQEVDRFMRSPDEQVYFQVKFWNEVDVKIWYADKPELNKDDIYSGLMRYMEGFRAAGSNDERQRKSISGQTDALKDGRYPFAPKPGYKKGSIAGIQEIHKVRGAVLRDTLLSIVTRRVTPTQALIDLNKSAFTANHSPYKMDKFRKIVTDPFYAAIVEIDKQVKVRNENGLHDPLITLEQHYELVRIMDGKEKTQLGPQKNGNPKYPLSNHVTHDACLESKICRFVGFNHGNGHSPIIYEKYRCRACGVYIFRQELHTKVEKHFDDNPISSEGLKDLLSALNTVWKQNEGQAEQDVIRIRHRIRNLNHVISQQVEAATDPENATIKQDILSAITAKKAEVTELEDKVATLKHGEDMDKEDFLRFAFKFVENMGSQFLDISPENRLRCKLIIFPAGFYMDSKKKVYTPEISPIIRLVAKKKDTEVSEDSLMVRVKGL